MPIFRKARNIGKYQMVLETGIEPVRLYGTRDFKSRASACSATRATLIIINQNTEYVNAFTNFFVKRINIIC